MPSDYQGCMEPHTRSIGLGSTYKDEFIKYVSEGYDAASRKLNAKNPYDWLEEHYKHCAWHVGSDWYQSMVH